MNNCLSWGKKIIVRIQIYPDTDQLKVCTILLLLLFGGSPFQMFVSNKHRLKDDLLQLFCIFGGSVAPLYATVVEIF